MLTRKGAGARAIGFGGWAMRLVLLSAALTASRRTPMRLCHTCRPCRLRPRSQRTGDPYPAVSFPPGAVSATYTGVITGCETVDYLLNAREGQVANISLATSNASAYFSILAPGGDRGRLLRGLDRWATSSRGGCPPAATTVSAST